MQNSIFIINRFLGLYFWISLAMELEFTSAYEEEYRKKTVRTSALATQVDCTERKKNMCVKSQAIASYYLLWAHRRLEEAARTNIRELIETYLLQLMAMILNSFTNSSVHHIVMCPMISPMILKCCSCALTILVRKYSTLIVFYISIAHTIILPSVWCGIFFFDWCLCAVR